MTNKYKDILIDDKYGFSYNPTGFEIAFVLNAFYDYIDNLNYELIYGWVYKQFKRHYCFKKGLMCKSTTDPNTLAARIYEATRLPNLEIDI